MNFLVNSNYSFANYIVLFYTSHFLTKHTCGRKFKNRETQYLAGKSSKTSLQIMKLKNVIMMPASFDGTTFTTTISFNTLHHSCFRILSCSIWSFCCRMFLSISINCAVTNVQIIHDVLCTNHPYTITDFGFWTVCWLPTSLAFSPLHAPVFQQESKVSIITWTKSSQWQNNSKVLERLKAESERGERQSDKTAQTEMCVFVFVCWLQNKKANTFRKHW